VIGEIGGTEEEELAEALRTHAFAKPVCVLLAGASAPEGVTMGHAGAIIQGARGSVASKTAALEAVGAEVFSTMQHLVDHVVRIAGRA
jgi:succinyl-CoA synthetase alpha subunit